MKFKKLLVSAALALSFLVSHQAPAEAVAISNTDWHQGRLMGPYSFGVYCTSGPHFYSYNLQWYMMALPRHCLETSYGAGFVPTGGNFASRYENSPSNYFDSWTDIYTATGPYPAIDAVMVLLGPASSASARQRASNNIFNYCNPNQLWNCSSYTGGGYAVNCNWCGSWKTVNGASTYSNFTGWGSVCKSGIRSGTSCGTVSGTLDSHFVGFISPVNKLSGIGGCGFAQGDSGSPVFHDPNGAWNVATSPIATAMGMAIAMSSTRNWTAASGNPCFSAGTIYSDELSFISNGDLMAAFPNLQLSPVIWNP